MLDELRAEKNFPSKPYDSLKNKSEFDRVYQRGFKKHNSFFSLFVLDASKEPSHFKNPFFCRLKDTEKSCLLGLSVSKKVGNAVKRNLIKRRLRSLVLKHASLCQGFALVFVPKKDCERLDFLTLEKHFLEMLISIKGYMNKKEKGTNHTYAKP
ncbi:ribonuclease P protein component [Helicobacter acinonychis]|uniref:Ribonuclease P protein component n=1 Tax=Helicobacter acinonychis (strain Sheeba) TaxID=382638 RepID=RNPA_HELAH|nr:ribonuclease P protein component [Helicobacter acinonychis]Q17ZA3.1 RecName: Full=Ribonuclease P protein component; Short=RNase P protein; Short=RNaseP protein; AltName: Full=Protein C5 [Helicobacter acinonychis str. Sheeba]CAJ99023.1 ribonuclease P protein component [Helicobacter acinonychis str. Sheeba]STP04855.1 ribonuclease P protein component [Helicobacter acinonychis]